MRAPLLFFMALTAILGCTLLGTFPSVLFDEVLYADTIFTFFKTGTLSNVLGGNSGREFFLYPLLIAPFLNLIPHDLAFFRLFNVIIACLSVGLFGLITDRLLRHQWAKIGTLACFSFSNILFISSRLIRPELLCTFFLLLGLYGLLLCHQKKEATHGFWVGTGLSLACLVHPLAIIFYVIFLSSYLLSFYPKKEMRPPIFFFVLGHLPSIFFLSFYFMFFSEFTPTEWVNSVLFSDRLPSSQGVFKGVINNLHWFWTGYSLQFKRAVLVLLELAALLSGLSQYKKQKTVFFLSSLALGYLTLMFFVFQPFLRPYYMAFVPLAILVMGLAADQLKPPKIGLLALLLYASISLMGNVYLLATHRHHESYSEIKGGVLNTLPQHSILYFDHHYFWFWRKHDGAFYHAKPTLHSEGPVFQIINAHYIDNRRSKISQDKTIFTSNHATSKTEKEQTKKLKTVVQSKAYGKIEVWELMSQ